MQVFWEKFNWSCESLASGLWPTHDWKLAPILGWQAGTSLMGGFRAYIWACIGDLDFFTKTYELPNSTSNSPCALCPCDSNLVPWWEFHPGARWIRMIYTHTQWLASGWKKCHLFNCPGVTILSMYPDWMHIKHLGVDKVLLGSVLWLLVHWVLPGDDVEAKLRVIWSDILRIYDQDDTPSRYGNLRLTMFTTGSTPKLKGKANEIKHLGPVLVKVWSAYMSQRMDLHKKVLTMLQLSAHLDVIVDATPGFGFDHASAVDLVSTGFAYLALFYEMSAEFKDEPVALFSLTAKAHYLMHICLLSRSCNFIGWVSLECCACVWVCSVVLVFARAC